MPEIILFGLVLLVAYFIAHYTVMAIERRYGKPLGGWRMAWFFLIFLALILAAQNLFPLLLGRAAGGPS